MTEHHEHHSPQAGDKGLKQDAIGFLDGLVIGISSTAPAYSLAAVLAIVVVGSLTALSLMIAFHYALTGMACAIYYRRELTKSVKNFLFIGVGPVVGR
jgi:hypothetical protein